MEIQRLEQRAPEPYYISIITTWLEHLRGSANHGVMLDLTANVSRGVPPRTRKDVEARIAALFAELAEIFAYIQPFDQRAATPAVEGGEAWEDKFELVLAPDVRQAPLAQIDGHWMPARFQGEFAVELDVETLLEQMHPLDRHLVARKRERLAKAGLTFGEVQPMNELLDALIARPDETFLGCELSMPQSGQLEIQWYPIFGGLAIGSPQ